MYRFSRAIYRELAPHLACDQNERSERAHECVLRACESAIERLATDRHYFARPARTLFTDIRWYFPMNRQKHVWQVVSRYMRFAQVFVERNPLVAYDLSGQPIQCRATTRKGTACQRMPLPHNGYCPSHQHLAETEDDRRLAA